MAIVAHPDDEIIGASTYLAKCTAESQSNVVITYATGGVPQDIRFANEAGFESRESYYWARQRERNEALAIAGIESEQCIELGLCDQETVLHLGAMIEQLSNIVKTFQPEVILTHPYEGGHPDHDSCALAVRRALELAESSVVLKEFACYHGGPHGFVAQEFLPDARYPIETLELSPDEQARKQRMYNCHRSQAPVLRAFSMHHEKFRLAPHYDFTLPPHDGLLHYETLGWPITGAIWREHAAGYLPGR